MRKALFIVLVVSLEAVVGCSDRLPTSPAGASTASAESASSVSAPAGRARRTIVIPPRGIDPARFGTWGSESASLTIEPGAATLKVLSANLPDGGCYGAFGDVPGSIPNGRFQLTGTFVQLMGVYPGRTEYPAQYDGFVEGDQMTLTVTVLSAPRVLGPYRLVYGAGNSWTSCLFP